MKTLFRNAAIVSPTEATCLVVEDDCIAYVGSEQNAPTFDKQVDPAGRRVLPGFIDGYPIPPNTCTCSFSAHLYPKSTSPSAKPYMISSAIRSGAAQRPNAQRLFCSGWMHSMINGQALTSMIDDLDHRPIFIDSKDLHSAWCNSAALADLGIDATTPNPEGGDIARDKDGQPSGLLSEAAAVTIVWPHVARVASAAEKLGYVRDAVAAYNAAGYTGMVEMATDENIWETIVQLRKQESVPIRLAMHWIISPAATEAEVLSQVDRAIALHSEYNKNTSPDFRISGIKVICDDSYSTAVPSLSPLWEPDILVKAVQRADAAGLQCALHAIGDAAVRLAIDALEIVKPAGGVPSSRHRIEHLELTSPGDAARLAALGITASIQPVHADPAILRAWPRILGLDRARRAFAYREFRDEGARVAIGTDSPTAPHLPLRNLYTATTRRSAREPECEETVNGKFALTLLQAVQAATAGSAYSCFADDITGSLDVGKKADFVVVEMDWEKDKLLEATVRETYLDGKRVFPPPT